LEDKRLSEEQERGITAMEQDDGMTREIIEGQEIIQGCDKGKSTFVDTTLVSSPIRTSREFGTASSRIVPEIREMLNVHQAQISSLIESDQRKQAAIDTTQQTMAEILSMLGNIQQRLPNPNP
jgi:hypothetical protein